MSVFIPIPKKGNAKECSNYCTVALISHASKVMLKILQARLQQYVNRELPDVQAGFRKGGGTRDQIANIRWIMEKAREFQKNIYFCFIDYAKAFDYVDHNQLWKILRDGNTRLVPNRKRSTSRLYIVTLLISLTCRVHHEKRWTGRSTSWNQDCQEKYRSEEHTSELQSPLNLVCRLLLEKKKKQQGTRNTKKHKPTRAEETPARYPS